MTAQYVLPLRDPAIKREPPVGFIRTDADMTFWRWFQENPAIYTRIVQLAREAKTRGYERIGIKHLWEVARWQLGGGDATDAYRWNNNHPSRLARLIQSLEPDLSQLFETRRLRS